MGVDVEGLTCNPDSWGILALAVTSRMWFVTCSLALMPTSWLASDSWLLKGLKHIHSQWEFCLMTSSPGASSVHHLLRGDGEGAVVVQGGYSSSLPWGKCLFFFFRVAMPSVRLYLICYNNGSLCLSSNKYLWRSSSALCQVLLGIQSHAISCQNQECLSQGLYLAVYNSQIDSWATQIRVTQITRAYEKGEWGSVIVGGEPQLHTVVKVFVPPTCLPSGPKTEIDTCVCQQQTHPRVHAPFQTLSQMLNWTTSIHVCFGTTAARRTMPSNSRTVFGYLLFIVCFFFFNLWLSTDNIGLLRWH